MAFDENVAIRQLIAVYRDAYVRLLNVIAEKSVTLRSTAFERALLADVFNIIRELDGAARQWSEQVIPKVYSASAEAVPAAWTAAGLSAPPLQAGFAQVHRAAVEVLVANFQDNMD